MGARSIRYLWACPDFLLLSGYFFFSTSARRLTVSLAPLACASFRVSGPVALKNSVMPRVLSVAQTQTAPLGVALVFAQPSRPPLAPAG